MAGVRTQVEELPENKVRLTVDVPSEDVKHAVDHAASDLATSLKVPGFRKGKVPIPVLLARVGRERLMSEAVESHIGGWFWNAAARERIRPVEQPEYGYDLPDSPTESWSFTATVAVQPKPDVADWTALEVPAPEADLPDELIEHELNVLRGSVAELAPVDGRPAALGDTLVVDLVTADGDAQRDYVLELGYGRVVPEIEEALVGAMAGETREIEFQHPDGDTRRITATVNEIKERVLPPLDDELARATSEFDSLAELRADIERRLREQLEEEVEGAVRGAAADQLVEASQVDASGPLVEARARELSAALRRSLERRGISVETYLAVTNQDGQQLAERLYAEARQSVARELVLEAAADKLGLEVSDEEVESLIREQAEAAGEEEPDSIVQRMRESGGLERLREDLRMRAALDRIAAEVKRIPTELAAAREQLWTPEKEKPETPAKLWTPGSKESR
jgi:trigger factor